MFAKLTEAVTDLKETKSKLEIYQDQDLENSLQDKDKQLNITKQEIEMLQQ